MAFTPIGAGQVDADSPINETLMDLIRTNLDDLDARLNALLKSKVIDIGDWDMDTNASKNVAHGLTLSNIRSVSFMIRNDAGTYHYLWSGNDNSQPAWCWVDSTNVVVNRSDAGFFNSTSFSATSYNRGWVTVWYV